MIRDGTRTIPCNPQTRNRNLVCCAERGRREISHDRHRNTLHSPQNEPNESAFDQVETIFDAKSIYQDVNEQSRTKHSIAVPRRHQQNLGTTYSKPNNLEQPVEQVHQTTQRNSGYQPQRPINEHIDLNYYEDDGRGRYQIPENIHQVRQTSTKRYEASTQPTRRPNYRPKPSASSGNDYQPMYEQTTRRYSQKTTASPWQEAPRPLVEDGNGYSQPNCKNPVFLISQIKILSLDSF